LAAPARYDSGAILAVLPQQPPFLFLDEASIEGETVRASYQIRGDEDLLRGHFKDDPVFPGSILFEAVGQAGCLWILHEVGQTEAGQLLFVMMDGGRCFRRATPGDRLDMEVTNTQLRKPLASFRAVVTCQGEKVAEVAKFRLAFGEQQTEGGSAAT